MRIKLKLPFTIGGCLLLFFILRLCVHQSSDSSTSQTKREKALPRFKRAPKHHKTLLRPSYVNKNTTQEYSIQIVTVVEAKTSLEKYKLALASVNCYSQAHNYSFLIVNDFDFIDECPQKDMFFRRHCIIAELLHKADYTMFIDTDIGIVNPKRRIEEFIENDKDIIFYDRFYNREVAAGSYLVKNSEWSKTFLKDYANYERHLPDSFHGTDNGAIHIIFLKMLFPERKDEYKTCVDVYKKSRDYDDLFAYESCCRSIMGIGEDFGRIKILKKGTGWTRDFWLTNSLWSPARDFMIHGWKQDLLKTYSEPPPIYPELRDSWYNPLAGVIDEDRCTLGNFTWTYDQNLIATEEEIEEQLYMKYVEEQKRHYGALARINDILER